MNKYIYQEKRTVWECGGFLNDRKKGNLFYCKVILQHVSPPVTLSCCCVYHVRYFKGRFYFVYWYFCCDYFFRLGESSRFAWAYVLYWPSKQNDHLAPTTEWWYVCFSFIYFSRPVVSSYLSKAISILNNI